MNLFFRFFLVFFCFTSIPVANADPTTDLTTLLNGVKTLQANFTQTTYDNRGKPVQKSFGRMALQRPGKFRWEVKRPIPQLIIANESRLWIYDPDLDQVTIRSLKHAAGETPALLLSHVDASINNEFTITEIEKNAPGWRWFSLTPKMADSMFASVEMGFMDKQIREMRLKDHLGHATMVAFESPKTNVNLPASLFTFTPPKNVDVIDETRKK